MGVFRYNQDEDGRRFRQPPACFTLVKFPKTGAIHPCRARFYRWFTEGFDTADLKEAKALLDELF